MPATDLLDRSNVCLSGCGGSVGDEVELQEYSHLGWGFWSCVRQALKRAALNIFHAAAYVSQMCWATFCRRRIGRCYSRQSNVPEWDDRRRGGKVQGSNLIALVVFIVHFRERSSFRALAYVWQDICMIQPASTSLVMNPVLKPTDKFEKAWKTGWKQGCLF